MGNSTKKKIELTPEDVRYLSEQPESGMGYQLVDIMLKDGRHLKNRVVVNSQFLLAEADENIDPQLIVKIELSHE